MSPPDQHKPALEYASPKQQEKPPPLWHAIAWLSLVVGLLLLLGVGAFIYLVGDAPGAPRLGVAAFMLLGLYLTGLGIYLGWR